MRILLTGASRGIGNTIKKLFENGGYEVFSPTRMELDLSKKIILKDSNFDIVINNAGINPISEFTSIEYDELVMKVNYFSPLHIIKQCIPYMIQNNYGRIVNIGSIWTILSKNGRSNYTSSKCAIDSLSRSITSEYSKYNILCNTISPGFIGTDLTYKNNSKEELDAIINSIPVNRLGIPEEIAELVYYLTIKNTFITGQNIIIDGGYSCVA